MKRNEINQLLTNVVTYEELKYILKHRTLRCKCGLLRVKLYPQDARDILKNHAARNRALSSKVVKDYKKAIMENRWSEDAPETIAFNKEGKMFDGNHRTHGLAECPEDAFVIMNVALGCNENPYTDTGKHRTPDDNLLCMGYIPTEVEEFYSKYILKGIGTIGNLQGIRSNVDSMTYMQACIKNNSNLIVEFQKCFNVNEKNAKEFRRIPILAATLNMFALGFIDSDDVAHIANVLHNVYSTNNIATTKDAPLLALARVSNDYKGGGETIKKNLFSLTCKAIIAYTRGVKGDIRKPQDRTMLELPTICDLSKSITIEKENEKRKMA